MLALTHPTQKPVRASFARMLAQLTLGIGISTGTVMVAGPAYSQTCDRCAGLNAPSCGCELARSSKPGPKAYSCNCVPKPSLGELLLSRLDKMGDRMEAKSRKNCDGPCDQAPNRYSNRGPTCGCESPQNPSCGCESNQMPSIYAPFHYSAPQSRAVPAYPGNPNGFAVGSIGDQRLNNSSIHSSTIPGKKKINPNTFGVPQALSDIAPDPVPTVQRIPFEPRTPTHNRIPELETGIDPQSLPNSLKGIPADQPPFWAPNTPTKRPTESGSKLPDVLVDPFKDDARIRGTRQNMEGVLLTSDRQQSTNALRLAPPAQAERETPVRLTPTQRNSNGLQFEATDSASSEDSRVVPSSFADLAPVKVAPRKEPLMSIPNDMPQVSKIRVPQKR